MEEKTLEININDHYGDKCFGDSLQVSNGEKLRNRKPQGEVHIYEIKDGKRELYHKSNIVVYLGREMLAQRLVNINSVAVPTKDEALYWFGLGEGGVVPADPLDPTPASNQDNDLSQPVMLNDATSSVYAHHRNLGDPADDPYYGTYTFPKTGFYKKRFDDDPEFETDPFNDDRYIILKITTTITIDDANGEQLSEAGLYSAESASGNYDGPFNLFARVTFPSIVKSADRRLVFIWYLYL